MKRLLFLLLLCLVLLVALAAVLNAPRVAEARAHEAAAHAMQTQAVVTGMAVAGMLLLVALLALVVGLFLWGVVTGRLAMVVRPSTGSVPALNAVKGQGFNAQPLKQRRMQIHHAPHPQLPTSHAQLSVPRYDADWETELDWSVWENTPWDIEEPF